MGAETAEIPGRKEGWRVPLTVEKKMLRCSRLVSSQCKSSPINVANCGPFTLSFCWPKIVYGLCDWTLLPSCKSTSYWSSNQATQSELAVTNRTRGAENDDYSGSLLPVPFFLIGLNDWLSDLAEKWHCRADGGMTWAAGAAIDSMVGKHFYDNLLI